MPVRLLLSEKKFLILIRKKVTLNLSQCVKISSAVCTKTLEVSVTKKALMTSFLTSKQLAAQLKNQT